MRFEFPEAHADEVGHVFGTCAEESGPRRSHLARHVSVRCPGSVLLLPLFFPYRRAVAAPVSTYLRYDVIQPVDCGPSARSVASPKSLGDERQTKFTESADERPYRARLFHCPRTYVESQCRRGSPYGSFFSSPLAKFDKPRAAAAVRLCTEPTRNTNAHSSRTADTRRSLRQMNISPHSTYRTEVAGAQ